MKLTSTKLKLLTSSLVISAGLLPALGWAQQSENTMSVRDTNAALDRAYGVDGLLNSLGLKNTKIVSAELVANMNSRGEDGSGLDTDGPTIVLETQISDRVRAQVKLAFQELIAVEGGRFAKPMDWNAFIEEAKIIIDQDPKSKVPFVTVIGKQELENGAFDTEMPIDDNSPLKGVTRIKGAYAVQFQMDQKLIKALDTAAFSVFTTGKGSEDTQGENVVPDAKGAMIVVSKSLSDRLILNGSLTRIAYPGQGETRLNWGSVYTSEKGGYKIFFNHAIFNYNPLYPNSKNAWTLGIVKKIGEKNSVTAETSRVQGVKTQLALGYRRQLTDRSSIGVGLRHDKCEAGQCTSDTRIEGQYRYSWERESK